MKTSLTLIKSLLNFRKNSKIISLVRNSRLSSFPFVSGDSFRALSDLILDHPKDFEFKIYQPLDAGPKNQRPIIVFIALSAIENDSNQRLLLAWAKSLRSTTNSKIKYITLNIGIRSNCIYSSFSHLKIQTIH